VDLQIIDTRPPLCAAIALAKQQPEGLPLKWRDDMAAMAAEVARKYFGVLTEDTVRDGVEGTVNLLSMGLLRASLGEIDSAIWVQTMRMLGVRGVSKLAVELIKVCDALPDLAAVYAGKDEFRPSLLLLLLSYASKNGAVRAYRFLLRETGERTEVQRLIKLAEWLFANTASGRITRRDMERFFGTDSPDAETAIHHILTLACGVAKLDPFSEPDMSEKGSHEMMPSDLAVTRLPAKRLAEARARYEALVQQIPVELRPALVFRGVSWIERFILPKTRAGKLRNPGKTEGNREHPRRKAAAGIR
jgi:hypothetical protein